MVLLDLSQNNLVTLHEDIFQGLDKLQVVTAFEEINLHPYQAPLFTLSGRLLSSRLDFNQIMYLDDNFNALLINVRSAVS